MRVETIKQNRKIKIDQYLVHGKHREFQVLVFPRYEFMWAYYEDSDERYEIDGDQEAYQLIKYALAALIAAPQEIIYFPVRDKGVGPYFQENYDAVLTRPELQFRHSEWINLRHQLNKAHQTNQFILRYEPEKLCNDWKKIYGRTTHERERAWQRFCNTATFYRAVKKRRQEVNKLLGDTVFLTMLKESLLAWHDEIIYTEQDLFAECNQDPECTHSSIPLCTPLGLFGWMIPHYVKLDMIKEAQIDLKKSKLEKEG